MKNTLTPKTANTYNKVLKLERDNVSTRNSWMTVSEDHISICNQRNGEERAGCVKLTRKEFERFIKFYETGK